MRNTRPLSRLDGMVDAYLSSRRALGRSYIPEEWVLRDLRKFLARVGAQDLNEDLFDCWRRRSRHLSTSTRLRMERTVYRFCLYRRRSESRCFAPDPLSFVRLRPYPLPMIIERHQIERLLAAASSLRPVRHSPIRSAVMRLAVVLLYTAGLRRGELTRLTLDDIDASAGVLRIRDSKFHKSRWVPLSTSARAELIKYLKARRRAGFDEHGTAPLLCSRHSRHSQAYSGGGLLHSLQRLCAATAVGDSQGRRPRLQDFRHSFAVGALLRWYEDGADVQTMLPRLALYMGHVSIVSTAYYLRFMPAVVERAGERFARSCGDLVDGGAP
jgi:integrase/recombinase XerD